MPDPEPQTGGQPTRTPTSTPTGTPTGVDDAAGTSLTPREAAEWLGLDTGDLTRLVSQKVLRPCVGPPGGRVRYRIDEVAELCATWELGDTPTWVRQRRIDRAGRPQGSPDSPPAVPDGYVSQQDVRQVYLVTLPELATFVDAGMVRVARDSHGRLVARRDDLDRLFGR